MWKSRLHDLYTDINEWIEYSNTYGLSDRLGYDSPEQAWIENPTIQGSVNPQDYRIADLK